MGALLRDTLKQFGGKGGGAKDFAQGSVADAGKAADVIAQAQKALAIVTIEAGIAFGSAARVC